MNITTNKERIRMKKFLALIIAAAALFACTVPAYAALPTALTFTEVKEAPKLDGEIDKAYGSSVFDFKATDIKVGDNNLFPRTQDELNPIKSVYEKMHSVGYAVYDTNNLYLAFDVYDVAPKAAGNSSNHWLSTNIQLVFYVNSQLCFPTIAYTGPGKVKVTADSRSEMDFSKIKASFFEKETGHYVYEVVIPWSACYEINSFKDVEDMRFGFVQTSMAGYDLVGGDEEKAYLTAAFGDAYDLQYDKLIPVSFKKLDSAVQNSNAGNNSGNTSGTDSGKSSVAPSEGVSVNASGSEVQSSVGSETQGSGEQIIETEETEKKDNKLIIILIAAAVVIIGGGAAAIIILNKKPADKTEEKN